MGIAAEVPPTAAACEDAPLLREFAHRPFNELAVAETGRGPAPLEQASARLRGLGEKMRMLARPPAASVDLGADLGEPCPAMLSSRPGRQPWALDLDLPCTPVDGTVARRGMLITSEFVANAHRHALAGRGGRLSVGLRRAARDLMLEVADDGPGPGLGAAAGGLELGSGIVGELAALLASEFALERRASGTMARLTVPAAPCRTERARDGR